MCYLSKRKKESMNKGERTTIYHLIVTIRYIIVSIGEKKNDKIIC